jgi:subtilisin family serine protease
MDITITHTYDSPEIHLGASIQLHPASKTTMDWSLSDAGRKNIMQNLKTSSAVQKVTRNQYLQPPASVYDQSYSVGAGISSLQPVALERAEQPRPRMHPRDLSDGAHRSVDASHATHVMMGIDLQHKKGNTGKGVTVCVVDGIIDFSHPVLNGGRPAGVDCIGGDCPLQGGYDFVGPQYDSVHRHPGPPKSENGW